MTGAVAATHPAETQVAPVAAPDFLVEEKSESDTEESLKKPAAKGDWSSERLYLGFLLVGCSAGWLLVNNAYITFGASYEGVQNSNFYGAASLITGAISIGLALLFALFQALRPRGLSRRAAQTGVGLLCVLTIIGQVVLAPWWNVQDEEGNYPVLLAVFGLGIVVATMTYFVAFPLVTTHYGGWLVAPFRAGTDVSLLVCALLSEAQSPLGGMGPHLFPAWVLQIIYVALAGVGLACWGLIVKTGAGLRKVDETPPQEQANDAQHCSSSSSSSQEGDECAKAVRAGPAGLLESLACPKSLLGPVLLGGMMSQVNYWALAVPIGNSSARMTDPMSCDGAQASAMFKAATTAGFCLVPAASLLSSFGRCPRPIFYALFVLQCLCVLVLWLSLYGVGRDFWQTEHGNLMWGIAYSLTGGLEGYLLTMTYRYVGDDPGVDGQTRASASSLVSFLGVLVTNGLALAIGIYMLNGGLECVEA